MPKGQSQQLRDALRVDDFTDPWKPAETLWIQHGFGRSSRFWYHWVPPLAAHIRRVIGSSPIAATSHYP